MINIDTRILSQLNENDFWLLMHLVKYLGKKGSVWPSNKTICRDTGWHIEKVQRIKKSLIDRGLLTCEFNFGSSNIYRFHTDFVGIFNGINGAELIDPIGNSDTPPTGKSYREGTGKSDNKVLANEALSIEQNTHLPFSSNEFKLAWQEWIQYKKESKKRMPPTTIKLQLKNLSKLSEHDAIEMIDYSITQGYTGLYPPPQDFHKAQGKLSVDTQGKPLPPHLQGFVQ